MTDNRIDITTTLFDGTSAEMSIDAARFRTFLETERPAIIDMMVSEGVGESLHWAFISVCEGQGMDLLYDAAREYPAVEEVLHDEDADASTRRLDAACRDAVWAFAARASTYPERRQALLHGADTELVNVVREWPAPIGWSGISLSA